MKSRPLPTFNYGWDTLFRADGATECALRSTRPYLVGNMRRRA